MTYDLITTLLNFPGFQVSDIRIGDRSAFRRVFVTIESLEGTHRCGECGKTGLPGYDHHEQEVRHLMLVAVLHRRALQALSGELSGLRDPDGSPGLCGSSGAACHKAPAGSRL